MGSPYPLQIDGMDGAKAVTSKIVMKKSTRDDADIDCTFVQVGMKEDTISYEGNCGNISAAVGPFAIEEGLVSYRPGILINLTLKSQEVHIYNTGTKKVILSHVPIDENGTFVHSGNEKTSGVPGTGSSILMDYRHTLGANLSKGKFLSGNTTDIINVGGKDVRVTICDVANWCVFAEASDFSITEYESAAEFTANEAWVDACQELRGKVGQYLGLTKG